MSSWRHPWGYLLGIVACMILGYFAFVQGARVTLLSAVDLGFHELGHLLFRPFPRQVMVFMGSGMQVLVPLLLAVYFGAFQRDLLGLGLMLAWAGTSAQDVSVYVADAPIQALPLLYGSESHDWHFLLSSWGRLDQAASYAAAVKNLGAVMLVAGIASCVAGLFAPDLRGRLATRREARDAAQREEYRSSLPVREPRNRPSSNDGGGAVRS